MECKTKWALKRMNEWTRLISGGIKQIYCNCFSPLILAVQRCLCLKLCLANNITCAITWYIQSKNQNWKNRLLKSKFRVGFRNEKMAWKAKNQTICLNAKQQKQQKEKMAIVEMFRTKVQCGSVPWLSCMHMAFMNTYFLWVLTANRGLCWPNCILKNKTVRGCSMLPLGASISGQESSHNKWL